MRYYQQCLTCTLGKYNLHHPRVHHRLGENNILYFARLFRKHGGEYTAKNRCRPIAIVFWRGSGMVVKTPTWVTIGALDLAGNPWLFLFVSLVKGKQLRSFARRLTRKAGKTQPDGFDNAVPRIIPKNIWMFWDKGIDEAPEIVRMCIASWQDKNPDWTLRILDKDTVAEFVDMPKLSPEMSIQSYSNILRFKLLKEHGGVWADATAFCIKPLNDWLPIVGQRGFFAYFWTPETRWFTWPGYTREVATWFLASEPQNVIMADWYDYSVQYWKNRQKPHLYFWCQTLFELLIYMRRPFRRALREVPKFGCVGPHLVHECLLRQRDHARVARILDDGAAPVQKLRWQWNAQHLEIAKKLLRVSETEVPKRPKVG